MARRNCIQCNKEYRIHLVDQKFCSYDCRNLWWTNTRNARRWAAGGYKKRGKGVGCRGRDSSGYANYRVVLDGLLYYEKIARIVAMFAIKSKLAYGATVHHRDGIRDNDMPSNLVICDDFTTHSQLDVVSRARRMGLMMPNELNIDGILHVGTILSDTESIIQNAIDWWISVAQEMYEGNPERYR